ncbi:MAG: AAA family ATPase, partial [Actinomycetota bacterium]
MKICVSGKGGSGKTTISGTLARLAAETGRRVIAIDADTNPNLALTLGVDGAVMDGIEPLPHGLMVKQAI